MATSSRPRRRVCSIARLHLACVFCFRARRLSPIPDLACPFYSDFVADVLQLHARRKFGVLVRFLQHHLWRFALVGRDFNRRSKRALGALVAFAMGCSRPRIYYTLEKTQKARGVSAPSASKRLP